MRLPRFESASWVAFCHACCVGLSVTLAVMLLAGWSSARDVVASVLALTAGWFVADLAGAIYHWNQDNYADGHNGFLEHHRVPSAMAARDLHHNVHHTAAPIALLLACALIFADGSAAAFLLALLNGVLYTEHAHSLAHRTREDLSPPIHLLQGVRGVRLLISPAEHARHHAAPLGTRAFGGLNGWSNRLTEGTQLFRALEAAREAWTGRSPAWRSAPTDAMSSR